MIKTASFRQFQVDTEELAQMGACPQVSLVAIRRDNVLLQPDAQRNLVEHNGFAARNRSMSFQ
jgi:hypothetical protein